MAPGPLPRHREKLARGGEFGAAPGPAGEDAGVAVDVDHRVLRHQLQLIQRAGDVRHVGGRQRVAAAAGADGVGFISDVRS